MKLIQKIKNRAPMAQMSRNDSFGLVLLASATLFLYSGIRMSRVVIVVVPHCVVVLCCSCME